MKIKTRMNTKLPYMVETVPNNKLYLQISFYLDGYTIGYKGDDNQAFSLAVTFENWSELTECKKILKKEIDLKIKKMSWIPHYKQKIQ